MDLEDRLDRALREGDRIDAKKKAKKPVTRPRKKHPGGRPPLPPGEAKGERITLWISAEDKRRAAELAGAHGLHTSEWFRRRIVHEGAEPER